MDTMTRTKLVVGSREIKLAVVQSNIVIDYLRENYPRLEVELLALKTTGDIKLDGPLYQIGGKGLFVKELDVALMERRSDISVHSLKDVPMEVSEELPLLGFSRREDERDALVMGRDGAELRPGMVVGCSSLRRQLQLKALYPGVEFRNVRGNVLTRLQKLDNGEYDALVLASAGLRRLGLGDRITRCFDTEELLPAAGQGILAIQGRRGEDYSMMEGFYDPDGCAAALAERAFVRRVNGGCSSPMAAHAVLRGELLELTALYYDEDRGSYRKHTMTGERSCAEEIGVEMGDWFRDNKGDGV